MTSGGVADSASETILYSASASANLPVPARAHPPPPEVTEDGERLHGRIRCRHGQNFAPMVEANLDRYGDRHEAFKGRHVFHVRAYVGDKQICILARFGVTAIHRPTHGDEMQIMAVIHQRVDALLTSRSDVGTVDLGGLLVCF